MTKEPASWHWVPTLPACWGDTRNKYIYIYIYTRIIYYVGVPWESLESWDHYLAPDGAHTDKTLLMGTNNTLDMDWWYTDPSCLIWWATFSSQAALIDNHNYKEDCKKRLNVMCTYICDDWCSRVANHTAPPKGFPPLLWVWLLCSWWSPGYQQASWKQGHAKPGWSSHLSCSLHTWAIHQDLDLFHTPMHSAPLTLNIDRWEAQLAISLSLAWELI